MELAQRYYKYAHGGYAVLLGYLLALVAFHRHALREESYGRASRPDDGHA